MAGPPLQNTSAATQSPSIGHNFKAIVALDISPFLDTPPLSKTPQISDVAATENLVIDMVNHRMARAPDAQEAKSSNRKRKRSIIHQSEKRSSEISVAKPLPEVEQKGTYGVRQILASRTIPPTKITNGKKKQVAIEYLIDWDLDESRNSWKPEWVRDKHVGAQLKREWKERLSAWNGISTTSEDIQDIVSTRKIIFSRMVLRDMLI